MSCNDSNIIFGSIELMLLWFALVVIAARLHHSQEYRSRVGRSCARQTTVRLGRHHFECTPQKQGAQCVADCRENAVLRPTCEKSINVYWVTYVNLQEQCKPSFEKLESCRAWNSIIVSWLFSVFANLPSSSWDKPAWSCSLQSTSIITVKEIRLRCSLSAYRSL